MSTILYEISNPSHSTTRVKAYLQKAWLSALQQNWWIPFVKMADYYSPGHKVGKLANWGCAPCPCTKYGAKRQMFSVYKLFETPCWNTSSHTNGQHNFFHLYPWAKNSSDILWDHFKWISHVLQGCPMSESFKTIFMTTRMIRMKGEGQS